jgi:hypothetical protein
MDKLDSLRDSVFGADANIYLQGAVAACALIGGYTVLKEGVRGMSFINRHMIRSQPDHFANYASGSDSYAVVTGGSDGIGLEICM